MDRTGGTLKWTLPSGSTGTVPKIRFVPSSYRNDVGVSPART